jgi:hypothetical protein
VFSELGNGNPTLAILQLILQWFNSNYYFSEPVQSSLFYYQMPITMANLAFHQTPSNRRRKEREKKKKFLLWIPSSRQTIIEK